MISYSTKPRYLSKKDSRVVHKIYPFDVFRGGGREEGTSNYTKRGKGEIGGTEKR